MNGVGACLLFYLEHFSDMETFHDAGTEAPKGIAPEEWRRVREVIGRAKVQATALLRRLQRSVMGVIGARRCHKYDQKATLTRDWNMQVQLKSENDFVSWMSCGIALDAPADGDGRLFFYIQATDQRKGKQARLLAELAGAGLRPIAGDGRWPAGCVIVGDLRIIAATTQEECTAWAERITRDVLLGHWPVLEEIGKS